jgi:hypothetical protein
VCLENPALWAGSLALSNSPGGIHLKRAMVYSSKSDLIRQKGSCQEGEFLLHRSKNFVKSCFALTELGDETIFDEEISI